MCCAANFPSRAYDKFMVKHAVSGRGEVAPQGGDAPGPPVSKSRKAFPVAALRELAIISCSTKLARLHFQLEAIKKHIRKR